MAWQEHMVTVRENDYLYNEQPFNSLTAIAYHITKIKWSGPRFFGLNKKEVS